MKLAKENVEIVAVWTDVLSVLCKHANVIAVCDSIFAHDFAFSPNI